MAKRRDVAIIVRVPLASGMLSGKFKRDSQFAADDHRNYNRHGEAFDVGETFAGVPYEEGLAAVEEIRALTPPGVTMAQFALRWILMQDGGERVIRPPRPAAGQENVAAAALPPIPAETMQKIAAIYASRIKPSRSSAVVRKEDMPQITIDAHQHFSHPETGGDYGWLSGPFESLNRQFDPT